MKLIVVDPRRTDTASGADLHLPLTPGSDVALFHAMLNVMVWEGLVDQDYISAHTSGFEALKARIHEFTPGAAAGLRHSRAGHHPGRALVRRRGRCLVAVHHGPEPVGQRHHKTPR